MLCEVKVRMDVLKSLRASKRKKSNKILAWRIVEDQSKSTTRKFADSTDAHELLEALIESSKPPIKYYGDEHYFKKIHYLLSTPFRYPPLPWGSRFGTRFERGIFYAAKDLTTALSEKAYYKLAFLDASEGHCGGKTVPYTAFAITIEGDDFIDLTSNPFASHEKDISSKDSYQFSQPLGRKMRENDIDFFQYKSARCHQSGSNIGVFSPKVLQNNQRLNKTFQYLNCYLTKTIIEFTPKQKDNRNVPLAYVYPIENYLVNGKIPRP